MSFGHVQGAFNSHGSGNVTSIAASGSAVGSGNLVGGFAECGHGTTGNFTSVSNGTSNATIVDDVADAGSGQEVISWYDSNVTVAPTTYTANFSTAAFDGIIWDEFSGAAASTPLDGHAMRLQVSPATGTDVLSTGSTIGNNGDLLYAGAAQTDTAGGGMSHGTGFTTATDHHTDVNMPVITEYMTQTAAHDGTFSIAATGSFVTGAMSFKPPAGGFTPKQRRTDVMLGTRVGSRQAIGM